MERILFIIKFPAEIWKNIKDEIRETFQKNFAAKLLNKIDNVVIIRNKVWYQLTYRLFDISSLYYNQTIKFTTSVQKRRPFFQ